MLQSKPVFVVVFNFLTCHLSDKQHMAPRSTTDKNLPDLTNATNEFAPSSALVNLLQSMYVHRRAPTPDGTYKYNHSDDV